MKRIDIIRRIAKQDGLIVTMNARAKAEGAVGDFIEVMNTTTSKSFVARVVSSYAVEVDFNRSSGLERSSN